ncbi:transcriptional regulator [Pollutimonas nitritireducens]|uniref:Transcriptional regulator n=1 Tax=Pollutimonas nitritireducens TaxID=2045209 RepID=A0A2N4UBK9_9BURK|nr:IclR family transcriptional regulator [Pollutimonas nitritireducens]PLC52400.1 transcriptional regulator [Pollutimonas nitritireducens]
MKVDSLNVASVGKALHVLQCFEKSRGDLSFTELVTISGLEKSSVQRFTHTLLQLGYLEKNVKTKRYKLGKKVLDLAFQFLRANSLVESINPLIINLCRATGEKISLSLFDDTTLVYVMRHQAKMEYYFSSLIGRRVPVFCTAGGRAILSKLDSTVVDEILARSDLISFTAKTITDKEQVKKEVALAKTNGYAVALEEIAYGEIALGAAVLDASGVPVASIHISGSLSEWTREDYVEKFSPLLLETVHRVNQR